MAMGLIIRIDKPLFYFSQIEALITHDIHLFVAPRMENKKRSISCSSVEVFSDQEVDKEKNGKISCDSNHLSNDLKVESSDDDISYDQCFGWIVVANAFLSCFVVGIMFISFSVLYMEFAEYFQADKGVTGWIGSLYLATGNICGKFNENVLRINLYENIIFIV